MCNVKLFVTTFDGDIYYFVICQQFVREERRPVIPIFTTGSEMQYGLGQNANSDTVIYVCSYIFSIIRNICPGSQVNKPLEYPTTILKSI